MRSWELKGQAIIYICKPGVIDGRKSNFILTFLFKGCLVYQVYQVARLQNDTSYARPIYPESINNRFLKSYGEFKMSFICATYTELSFLFTDEIPRVWLN